MNPTHMRVPVGTTVTFLNPGAATFPNFPNEKLHCATQFFEGLFNPKLNPGESFQYTFRREGEYFFNDCTDPRPTGKVVAYHVPQDVPGALEFDDRSITWAPALDSCGSRATSPHDSGSPTATRSMATSSSRRRFPRRFNTFDVACDAEWQDTGREFRNPTSRTTSRSETRFRSR
jgi:hypothetical protein